MDYSKVKIKKLKLNKRIKVTFKKLKKYFKIGLLLIYFNIRSESYIETNTLIIILISIFL